MSGCTIPVVPFKEIKTNNPINPHLELLYLGKVFCTLALKVPNFSPLLAHHFLSVLSFLFALL